MLRLPSRFAAVIPCFAPLFFQRSWRHAEVLLIGAIPAPGRRRVSSILRIAGLARDRRFVNYHRVLNRAAWSGRAAARVLLGLPLDAFVPTGPVVLGLDGTIERRRGKRISAEGIYRDPVRSGHVPSRGVGVRWFLGELGRWSGWHGGQPGEASIADGADAFQGHVAGALGGPFVGLLQQQGADKPDDRGLVREYANNIRPALDLAIEALDGIRAVQLGPVRGRECHIGQDILLGGVHQGGQFRHFGAELVSDAPPLGMRRGRVVLGVGGADPGRDDPALGLARMHQGVAGEMHDPNAIDVLRLVMSLPFAGAGSATKRQRRDAKFPRGED
jgi:hypothetical protein